MNAASTAAVAAFSHPGDDIPVGESAVDMSNLLRTGTDLDVSNFDYLQASQRCCP